MQITAKVKKIGISRAHYWRIRTGRSEPNVHLALRIYDELGERYGVLARLSPEEIEKLR